MAEVDPKLCIALDDINEAMDCENQDNMGGIIPSVIFGYHADVATWPDYPKKTESPLSLEEAGTLVGDLVMKESCRAYKMDFTDELAEFKITDQGESGGESFLMDLNIISAKMRKKIFGFENATKGRKMFFIVTDNNGTNYLMGDKRRGAPVRRVTVPLPEQAPPPATRTPSTTPLPHRANVCMREIRRTS